MGLNDDSGISNSERAFILQVRCLYSATFWSTVNEIVEKTSSDRPQALGEEKRIDGRGLYEYRPIQFEVPVILGGPPPPSPSWIAPPLHPPHCVQAGQSSA